MEPAGNNDDHSNHHGHHDHDHLVNNHPEDINNINDNDDDFVIPNDMENILPEELVHHPAVLAFQVSRASFLVTDPRLPGNPIVYASRGFLELTGYAIDRVLGRNCRFLQGPETDPLAVAKMREALDQGLDVNACLLNYKQNGETFWNHILISGIRTSRGVRTNENTNEEDQQLVYFLGLQCPTKAPPMSMTTMEAMSLSNSSSSIATTMEDASME